MCTLRLLAPATTRTYATALVWLLLLTTTTYTAAAAAFSPHYQHRASFLSSTSTTTTTTQLHATGKYNKIFVAGGSRGVGRCIVDKLLQQGKEVVALIRDPSTVELPDNSSDNNSKFTYIVGDAFDQKTVENAMDGCDAAITTLGGSVKENDQTKRIDYEGNNNVIESAGILGVTRVLLVTSIGCGSSQAAAPPSTFETLKEVLAAKERAENVLIRYYTNTNWTIIRPGGLKSEPATGKAILTEDTSAIGSIHREDIAQLIVDALEAGNTERKILSAVDPSITSAVNVEGRTVEAFALS